MSVNIAFKIIDSSFYFKNQSKI